MKESSKGRSRNDSCASGAEDVQFRQNAEWLQKGILGAGVCGAKCWLVNGYDCLCKENSR